MLSGGTFANFCTVFVERLASHLACAAVITHRGLARHFNVSAVDGWVQADGAHDHPDTAAS
jgi:hypothetical protein